MAANQNPWITLFRCPQWLGQRQSLFKLERKANRWGDLSFSLEGWSNERKGKTLQNWKLSQEMVLATIKFAIATHRLSDKKEGRELEHRAGRSADEDENLQNSSAEEYHDK